MTASTSCTLVIILQYRNHIQKCVCSVRLDSKYVLGLQKLVVLIGVEITFDTELDLALLVG